MGNDEKVVESKERMGERNRLFRPRTGVSDRALMRPHWSKCRIKQITGTVSYQAFPIL